MSTLSKTVSTACSALLCIALLSPHAARAEWKPKGPINLMIAFAAGGGADTQARLIAAELEKRKGWQIIPSNVAGKGGAVLAKKMKGEPNDGQTIGLAVTEAFEYNMLASKSPGFTHTDFTYITTTAGSQMGAYVRSSSGWKTWDDLVKAARDGQTVKVGVMGPKLADITYVLGKKFGVQFNTVVLKGGRDVLNAVTAGDVDLGFGAGIQNKAVRSGSLVQILSVEKTRLEISPDAPTLAEIGLPYDNAADFLIFAPKGIPEEARSTIAAAVADILRDKDSQATQFAVKSFGGPKLVSGAELEKSIERGIADSRALMAASN